MDLNRLGALIFFQQIKYEQKKTDKFKNWPSIKNPHFFPILMKIILVKIITSYNNHFHKVSGGLTKIVDFLLMADF